MAFLLLASTVSWTVGKHYCMGRLMNVSLFEHAEDCGMAMQAADESTIEAQDEDSCCSDEFVLVDGQEDLKISVDDSSLERQLFLVAFTHSYFHLFKVRSNSTVPNEYYPPPLLVKDIQLLDEVYLI